MHEGSTCYILAYQTRYFLIFTSAFKSYLTYPYQTRGIDKKRNNNICCQYIGCIEGHITLSLRRWEQCHIIQCQFQYGKCQRIGTWLINGDYYLKIKCSRSKGIYHGCLVQKNLFLGITVWHHLAKPRDANSDPWADFSIRTSHPWKILIV